MTISIFDSTPAPTQINTGAVAGVLLTTAMANTTNYDGTQAAGTAMALVFTAGSAGSQLPKLRVRYSSTAGAAASGTTSATVVRIWATPTGVNTTAANNVFIGEVAVPSILYDQTKAPTQPTDFDFGLLSVPAGCKIYAGLATAIGGTNCALAVNMLGGGDYS